MTSICFAVVAVHVNIMCASAVYHSCTQASQVIKYAQQTPPLLDSITGISKSPAAKELYSMWVGYLDAKTAYEDCCRSFGFAAEGAPSDAALSTVLDVVSVFRAVQSLQRNFLLVSSCCATSPGGDHVCLRPLIDNVCLIQFMCV